MAIIKNGANGTLSGKAGSVVFVTNGNTTYARGLPQKSKKKPTAEQIESRTRFTLVQKFLSHMLGLIQVGFKNYKPNKKAYGNAMSYNLNNAVEKTETGYSINYENFRVSKGTPNPITSYTFQVDQENGIFNISWEYDADMASLNNINSSNCRLFLYNPGVCAFTNESMNPLIHKKQHVNLYRQQTVGDYHVYIFFCRPDGSSECTDSKYLGTFEW